MSNDLKQMCSFVLLVSLFFHLFVGINIGSPMYIVGSMIYTITFVLMIWEKCSPIIVFLALLAFLVVKSRSVVGINSADFVNIIVIGMNCYYWLGHSNIQQK